MQTAKLSCEQCQQRKTKCDKSQPCSACVKAGHQCTPVHRQRLPRGRSGKARGREDALKARIGRLESVVTQLQGLVPPSATQRGDIIPTPPGDDAGKTDGDRKAATRLADVTLQDSSPSSEPGNLGRLMAPTFWTELTDAVAGLRDALEETRQEDDSTPESLNDQQLKSEADADSRRGSSSNTVLFGQMTADRNSKMLGWLPPGAKHFLLTSYRDRIDPILKGTHWPTVALTIGFGSGSPPSMQLSVGARALEAAMCFLAACIVSDADINGRETVVAQCRFAAERSLNEAGLLSTTDFVVLQAFSVYVAALRIYQCNADQWTLVACLIRVASAQGLNRRPDEGESSLDAQMRLRLWFMIGLLDLQASFDRGTKPLLNDEDFPFWPADVNDATLTVAHNKGDLPQESMGFTDMTFPLMTYQAMFHQHRFSNLGVARGNGEEKMTDREIWEEKLRVLGHFEMRLERLSQNLPPNPTPFARYIILSARYIFASMRLTARRPLYPPIKGRPPPEDDLNVLQEAATILEYSLGRYHLQDFVGWGWNTWVPWYALAVVLAELCRSPRNADTERAWDAAQRSYVAYAQRVADGQTGLLWKPVERLMQRARTIWKPSSSAPTAGIVDQQARPQTNVLNTATSLPMVSETFSSTYPPQSPFTGNPGDETMSWFDWEYFLEGFGDDPMMRL